MCLAQDKSKVKAVALHTPSKLTLESLLQAGQSRSKKTCHHHPEGCDATLTTVGTGDESHASHRDPSPNHRDDVEVEVALSHTFDLDLSFDQIPTGGLISMPRNDQSGGYRSLTSSPSSSTSSRGTEVPLLSPKSPSLSNSQQATHDHHMHHSFQDLHIECAKSPSFSGNSYLTPRASSKSEHGHGLCLTPPPTPKHSRLSQVIFFDQWPEHLFMPQLT